MPCARHTCIRAHNTTQASGIQVWISCSYECVLADGPCAACELLSETVIQQVLLHVHGTVRATPAGSVMHGFQIEANALVSCNHIFQHLQRVVSNGEPVVIHLRMYKQDSERGAEADTDRSGFAPDSVLGWRGKCGGLRGQAPVCAEFPWSRHDNPSLLVAEGLAEIALLCVQPLFGGDAGPRDIRALWQNLRELLAQSLARIRQVSERVAKPSQDRVVAAFHAPAEYLVERDQLLRLQAHKLAALLLQHKPKRARELQGRAFLEEDVAKAKYSHPMI